MRHGSAGFLLYGENIEPRAPFCVVSCSFLPAKEATGGATIYFVHCVFFLNLIFDSYKLLQWKHNIVYGDCVFCFLESVVSFAD